MPLYAPGSRGHTLEDGGADLVASDGFRGESPVSRSSMPPATLRGKVIESEVQAGVRYQLERR